jgi:hypothetical protein
VKLVITVPPATCRSSCVVSWRSVVGGHEILPVGGHEPAR